ncbi:MAG: hypothetical protein AAF656_06590 [Planctomycetota bacterium]
MQQSRAMFVLVLIASTVMCAEAHALAQEQAQRVAQSSAEPLRMVRKLAGERQQTTRTVLTPRLVEVLRADVEADRPVDVHVPHRAVHPFRFRLPPPVGV